MIIAGVMSGSSLDGLDVAMVRFDSAGNWMLEETYAIDYSNEWVTRLKTYKMLSATEYIQLKYDYSYYIAKLLQEVFGTSAREIDYLSFHGHTLVHHPEKGYTEQIGNGAIIASKTGISTLTDFRNQDIALGGQGTPMAPIVEQTLFSGYDYYLNLGGIANISMIREGKCIEAYDICPCNQVLNFYSNQVGQPYDDGGQMARNGNYLEAVVGEIDQVDYFYLSPPKSLDNNWIQKEFIPRLPSNGIADLLHTYVVWMAGHIADQIIYSSTETQLFVTGGGAHNTFFVEQLTQKLQEKNCKVIVPERKIVDNKEAMLMSVLAYNYLMDKPNVLSTVTGAQRDSIGGALYKIGYKSK